MGKYKNKNWCSSTGGKGPGWKETWGNFEKYAKGGQTAWACPQCGCSATTLECALGTKDAVQKRVCGDGANNLCTILLPLKGTKKDQISYKCMKTSDLSTYGFTETVKQTQTCQKNKRIWCGCYFMCLLKR